MPVIDCRPGPYFAFAFPHTVDGVSVVFAFRWLPRFACWACMMRAPDGTQLTPQEPVWPGGAMVLDGADPRQPRGRIRWEGPDDYDRADLGASLRMIYESTPESEGTRYGFDELLSRTGLSQ